ncbi:phage tail assembly protein [Herbaspirillum seropedicae]|uniref:Bacteriophage-related tail protein n=1 Tax=Herbaspirillum seropedicae (strain SmR1) TaxID=757424 RepID=D8J067_HERSS|nr:phage tail assembly protein [Herbaspirillum seropedicae]ADJ62404.1 bacteriophage-related tail protein [Herbaspirillum seropedicae SmR1]AKN64538.1 tail fiber protein [Herbaspirillum seropedicae]NQE31041.1 tail fiber protein [Herbaspirillum seropedicae]UMU20476.1 phage tail assembly protein [Herbaspirillum seropedicae]
MTTNTTTAAKIESVVVELDEPLTRGNTQITELTLRRPKSGALRGVSLMDLMNMNVSALQVVLPRISEPTLTQFDVANMDPADLIKCGMEVSVFLAPKADRALVSQSK